MSDAELPTTTAGLRAELERVIQRMEEVQAELLGVRAPRPRLRVIQGGLAANSGGAS